MEDLDQLFIEQPGWSAPQSQGRQQLGSTNWIPPVEVLERGGQLIVRAEVPGMNKDQIQVEIEDDQLVLSGERMQEHEDKREGFYRTERSYGRFYRVIPLPEGVNPEQAKATFSNGVLEISMAMPQQQQSRGKKIEVQEGDPAQISHSGQSQGASSSSSESGYTQGGSQSGYSQGSSPQRGYSQSDSQRSPSESGGSHSGSRA